jgi:hypothetical protein
MANNDFEHEIVDPLGPDYSPEPSEEDQSGFEPFEEDQLGFGFFTRPHSYFNTDRLVGIFENDNFDRSPRLIYLVHITARFGMFSRSVGSWIHIQPNWDIDPKYNYINFKDSNYQEIIKMFDNSIDDYSALTYEELKKYRATDHWESEFYLSYGPRRMLNVVELINQAQFFVEPKPKILGHSFRRIDEAHDAGLVLQLLQRYKEDYENKILTHLKRNSSEKIKDNLKAIEMYPPLHQAVLDLRNKFYDLISSKNLIHELEEYFDHDPYEHYLNGITKVSIEFLTDTYKRLMGFFLAYSHPLNVEDIKSLEIKRHISALPKSRLELWVNDGKPFVLVANTQIGQFLLSNGNWHPRLMPDTDSQEDIYTLSGPEVIHLKPELASEIISYFRKSSFEDIKLDNSDFRHFQVSYDPDTKERDQKSVNFGYELYLSNYEPGVGNIELAYSKLDSLSKQIFSEVFNNISSNYKFLKSKNKLREFIDTEYEYQNLTDFIFSRKSLRAHVISSAINAYFTNDGENFDDVANRERKLIEERNQKNIARRKGFASLIKKATMSTTPFGPGSFSFIFDENKFVEHLVVETDMGTFILDTPNPDFPDFPLWTIWDFQEVKKKNSFKYSVLIGQKYVDAAVYLYLDSLKTGEALSRDTLAGFWQDYEADEIPEAERLIWHTQSRKISELPFEIQYLGKWAKSFMEKFVKENISIDSWVSISLFNLFLDDSFAFNRDQVLMMFYILTHPVLATSKTLDKKDCESLLKEIYEKLTKEVGITPYDPGDDIAVID